MENNMTKEQIKQTIEGFTSFMRGISNNPNLNVPKELADKYDISEEFREKMEGCAETKRSRKMVMTIDDAKSCLENGGFCSASCKYFSEGGPDCENNVRKIAIKTMCKYQKIEQIVNNYISSGKPYISVIDEDIRKVIEDE